MSQRTWLLVRALITLGTSSLARTKFRVARSNADRGGNLARRRIESSYGCARASIDTAEIGQIRLRSPRCVPLRRPSGASGNRGQGLSSRGNTSRASFGESTSQRWRREVVDVRGGVTSAHIEVRDEVIRKDRFTPPAKSQKEQALESTPVEGVSGNENTRRVTMTRVEVALVGPASVARLQRRGQERGSRQRRQR